MTTFLSNLFHQRQGSTSLHNDQRQLSELSSRSVLPHNTGTWHHGPSGDGNCDASHHRGPEHDGNEPSQSDTSPHHRGDTQHPDPSDHSNLGLHDTHDEDTSEQSTSMNIRKTKTPQLFLFPTKLRMITVQLIILGEKPCSQLDNVAGVEENSSIRCNLVSCISSCFTRRPCYSTRSGCTDCSNPVQSFRYCIGPRVFYSSACCHLLRLSVVEPQ